MATTYKNSGVNIDAGNELVKKLKKIIPSIGGFSGLFPLIDIKKYTQPVLVCSTDGVGTKLKVAQLAGRNDTVGIDLVAMCVNDIITSGAKPLLFLDYFATGKLQVGVAGEVIKGIQKGCRQSGCLLIGGETAEMPGFYGKGEYDLAGFCVGIIDRKKIIDGSKIKADDLIIGLPSSGVHSNGYSMVRKVFTQKELRKHSRELLKPTRIYVKDVLSLLSVKNCAVKGICHITGGGFYDNVTRILPRGLGIEIFSNSWKVPQVFGIIQSRGNVSRKEMYRTFNMGIGMVLIVSQKQRNRVFKRLKSARIIGRVVGKKGVRIV